MTSVLSHSNTKNANSLSHHKCWFLSLVLIELPPPPHLFPTPLFSFRFLGLDISGRLGCGSTGADRWLSCRWVLGVGETPSSKPAPPPSPVPGFQGCLGGRRCLDSGAQHPSCPEQKGGLRLQLLLRRDVFGKSRRRFLSARSMSRRAEY